MKRNGKQAWRVASLLFLAVAAIPLILSATASAAFPTVDQSFGRHGWLLSGVGSLDFHGEGALVKLNAGAADRHVSVGIEGFYLPPYRQIISLDDRGRTLRRGRHSWLPGPDSLAAYWPTDDGGVIFATGRWVRKLRPDGKPVRSFGTKGRLKARGLVQDLMARPDGSFVVVSGRGDETTAIESFSPSGKRRFAVRRGWQEMELTDLGADGTMTLRGEIWHWEDGLPIYLDREGVMVLDRSGALRAAPAAYAGLRIRPGGFIAVDDSEDQRRLVSLKPDLTVDPDFSFSGMTSCHSCNIVDFVVDSRGRVYARTGGSPSRIERFLPDGSPDPSFQGAGRAPFPKGRNMAMDTDRSDRLIRAGWYPGAHRLILRRFTEAGDPDPAFGKDGVAELRFPVPNKAEETFAIPGPHGGLTVAARTSRPEDPDLSPGPTIVRRFTRGGKRDRSFGNAGFASIPQKDGFTPAAFASRGLKQTVFAGSRGGSATLRALDGQGRPDRRFGTDGFATLPERLKGPSSTFLGVTADPAGTLTAVGWIAKKGHSDLTEGHRDWLIARFKPDGSPDARLGSGGVRRVDVGKSKGSLYGPATSDADALFEVAVDRRGRALVAGISARQAQQSDLLMARFRSDGRLDARFGKRGMTRWELQLTKFSDISARPTDIVVSPTGRIVVANGWNLGGPETGHRPWNLGILVAADRNGHKVRSFGRRGVKKMRNLAASGLAIDRCNRVTVGGALYRKDRLDDFGVARYRADGSPDRNFAGGKIRRIVIDAGHRVRSVDLIPAGRGRMYLAGAVRNATRNTGMGVARIRTGTAGSCRR